MTNTGERSDLQPRRRAVYTTIEITGPYDLREVALMSFGPRDESGWDGAMRMAFCLDGGYERPVGVVARQFGDRLELLVEADGDPLGEPS